MEPFVKDKFGTYPLPPHPPSRFMVVGGRGGSRYVEGCWGFPYLKKRIGFLVVWFLGLWFLGFLLFVGLWFLGLLVLTLIVRLSIRQNISCVGTFVCTLAKMEVAKLQSRNAGHFS